MRDGGRSADQGAGMTKLMKKRSKKEGLPPGTLVHIGEKSGRESSVRIIEYDRDRCDEREDGEVARCFNFVGGPGINWINIEGLHELELIGNFGECLGFHPLMLEDIVNTDQRPKLEDYEDYLYIVVKMLNSNEKGEIVTEQISLVLGQNYVISFQEGLTGDSFEQVRERIKGGKSKIRSMGADYLAYALLDAVVDGYFKVLEQLGERIEALEEEVVANPSPNTIRSIHGLKREMILLRRALWPLREVIGALERRESPLISEPVTVYLRDVYDHTVQAIDAVEAYRDILSGLLDVYLSSISNRLNEIMKFLTIIGTIFLPLTFIVGLYGMNFANMPELHWKYGYYACLLGMLGIAVMMLVYFKRKKWL